LEAVEGTETCARLLDPPSVADIAAALVATASSALVYLLLADDLQPGLAVIIHADGTVQPRELPGLRSGAGTVFDAFSQARRAFQAAESESAQEPAPQRWQARLNEVCDWAWTAAMDGVLSVLGRSQSGRPTRWMLDKRRKLPEGIGRRLARVLTRHDLTETAHWAAFTYQGQ
jgi:hypothetical protein